MHQYCMVYYRYVYVKDLANRALTFSDKTQASFKKWWRGERKRKEKTKVTARKERYGSQARQQI